MLFSHNIWTPLPQPEFLVNNALPPGQAVICSLRRMTTDAANGDE
jgi:hypothetical protein